MVAYSIVNNSLFLLVIEAENPTMKPPAVSMSSQVSPSVFQMALLTVLSLDRMAKGMRLLPSAPLINDLIKAH